MKKLSLIVLLIVFIIAAANNSASADEDPHPDPVTAKEVRQICSPAVKAFKKIMKEELEQRNRQQQPDIRLLAEVMYHENWSTDKDHLAAYYTGAVVLNRVKSKNYPNTVEDVVYQKGQYAVLRKLYTKELPEACLEMAADLIKNGAPDVPDNVVYQATFRQGKGLWKSVNGEKFCYE